MQKKEILEKVATYIKNITYDESTGHDWWHIKRVYALSLEINKKEQKDEFIICMISLLHDVYDEKFSLGDTKIKIITLLKNLNVYEYLTKADLDHILFSVKNLGFKGGFNNAVLSSEAKIVQDSDRLDAIGAIGIARVFSYGGKKGLSIYNPDQGIIKINSEEEYRRLKRHSINHFYEKLLNIKDTMNTEQGKNISIERTIFMETYLQEFFYEWNI